MVDGGFFIKRYKTIKKIKSPDPQDVARFLWQMCRNHLNQKNENSFDLYRIFYYDCEPYSGRQHNPLSNRAIDYSKTEQYIFRTGLLDELKKMRKVALRLGELYANQWSIRPVATKKLLRGEISVEDLSENDVVLTLRQKQVDMKIDLDIASLTYQRQVDQIILISGDSDFVPAAKMARRGGIDFILDPMWQQVESHLFEHIDGLTSKIERPK